MTPLTELLRVWHANLYPSFLSGAEQSLVPSNDGELHLTQPQDGSSSLKLPPELRVHLYNLLFHQEPDFESRNE